MDSERPSAGMASDTAGIGSINRLGKCESCILNDAKYKCPKCSASSCSLECVRKHKVEKSCPGKRDRTEYVSKKEYTEQHWNSDLGFIQDAHTIVASVKKSKNALPVSSPEAISGNEELPVLVSASDKSKKSSIVHLHPSKRQLKQRKILVDVLKQRGILFDSLPEIFSKRKRNNTHIRTENGERKVYWMIQVVLVVPEGDVLPSSLGNALSIDKKITVSNACLSNGQTGKSHMKVLSHIPESLNLDDVWSRFVKSLGRDHERVMNRGQAGTTKDIVPQDTKQVSGDQRMELSSNENGDHQECEDSIPPALNVDSNPLEDQSLGWNRSESIRAECFLKAEKCRCVGGSGDAFVLMPAGSILQSALCHQVVVEYPTLVFVLGANAEELHAKLPKPCMWCLSASRGIVEEDKILSEITECKQKKSEILCSLHWGQYEKMV
mmetsp:Transcript_21165/g.36370  ORF Transcript_21165/g.36370 Transcript_21165/m.36370 type:complete len:438 (+) Transcript_21165:399-1712(+)